MMMFLIIRVELSDWFIKSCEEKARCALFVPGKNYEKKVGTTGKKLRKRLSPHISYNVDLRRGEEGG